MGQDVDSKYLRIKIIYDAKVVLSTHFRQMLRAEAIHREELCLILGAPVVRYYRAFWPIRIFLFL